MWIQGSSFVFNPLYSKYNISDFIFLMHNPPSSPPQKKIILRGRCKSNTSRPKIYFLYKNLVDQVFCKLCYQIVLKINLRNGNTFTNVNFKICLINIWQNLTISFWILGIVFVIMSIWVNGKMMMIETHGLCKICYVN